MPSMEEVLEHILWQQHALRMIADTAAAAVTTLALATLEQSNIDSIFP